MKETDIRHPSRRRERRAAAVSGWWNWYHDRGRLSLQANGRDMRMISWRRAL